MTVPMVTRSAALALTLLLTACGTTGPRLEPSLDPDRGEMVVALRKALVFDRPEPGLSLAARDYLYLGPIETNVSGQQQLYLWVGLAGTIDRAGLEAPPVVAESLRIQLNDEPVTLVLEDWHSDTRNSPFDISVPLQRSMRAPVTAEQLQHIAAAEQLQVTLVDHQGAERPYGYWAGTAADWVDAQADTEVAFRVQVRTPGQL